MAITTEEWNEIYNKGYQKGFEHGKSNGRYEKFSEWDARYNKPKNYDIGESENPPVARDNFYKQMLEAETGVNQ